MLITALLAFTVLVCNSRYTIKLSPISEASFLASTQQRDLFNEFREILYDYVVKNIMRLEKLSTKQIFIRRRYFSELVEAAIVHHYNKILNPLTDGTEKMEIVYLGQSTIDNIRDYIEETIQSHTLESYSEFYMSHVSLNSIPVNVLEFFNPRNLHLENTGLSDGLEPLYSIDSIRFLNLSHNKFCKIPELHRFSNLISVFLDYNPIEITDSDNIIPSKTICYIGLDGIPGIGIWQKKLEEAFKSVRIVDPRAIYESSNSFREPALQDTKAIFTTYISNWVSLRKLIRHREMQLQEIQCRLNTSIQDNLSSADAILHRMMQEAIELSDMGLIQTDNQDNEMLSLNKTRKRLWRWIRKFLGLRQD